MLSFLYIKINMELQNNWIISSWSTMNQWDSWTITALLWNSRSPPTLKLFMNKLSVSIKKKKKISFLRNQRFWGILQSNIVLLDNDILYLCNNMKQTCTIVTKHSPEGSYLIKASTVVKAIKPLRRTKNQK